MGLVPFSWNVFAYWRKTGIDFGEESESCAVVAVLFFFLGGGGGGGGGNRPCQALRVARLFLCALPRLDVYTIPLGPLNEHPNNN